MDVEELMRRCAALPGAWRDNPWGHQYPVYKVGGAPDVERERGRIFAFCGAETLGLKCGSREEADEWLLRYPEDAAVMPHLGRSGWNDLLLAGTIPDEELVEALQDSYRMVVSRLPRRLRPAGWEQLPPPTLPT